jgi:methionyl-tRNA formyltransferase
MKPHAASDELLEMRLLFFGDGAWAADSLRRIGRRAWKIGAVVLRQRPSNDALERTARELGVSILQPRNPNSPEFLEVVRSLQPALNVSVSYDQIIRRPLLDAGPLGFVNFHAGKLPLYRGRNVLNWALINGETEIGITGHFMDEGIDTGDIILQRALPVAWTDTYGDVLDRVVTAFPDLVEATLDAVATGHAPRQRQAHLPGTYFGGRGAGDEWLDWSETSRNLHNKVRAISRPGPGARTHFGPRVVRIWKALYDPAWPSYVATPGQVVGRRSDGLLVKTGDSVLLVQEIQCEDGPPQIPAWEIGARLGRDVLGALRSVEDRLRDLEKELSERQRSR